MEWEEYVVKSLAANPASRDTRRTLTPLVEIFHYEFNKIFDKNSLNTFRELLNNLGNKFPLQLVSSAVITLPIHRSEHTHVD